MNKKTPIALPFVDGLGEVTSQEMAYRRLRQAIMIGRIAPGAAVTIRGLAEVLGVSPTPVREALRRLAAENALVVLDNRRVMTPFMTASRFEELIGLRVTLECYAVDRLMPYINDDLIADLEAIDEKLDAAARAQDLENMVIFNQQFHARMYTANPEQVIMPMIESIWLQMGPFTRVALSQLSQYYTVDRHREAIEALRRRDRIGVSIAIEADIRDALSHLSRSGIMREMLSA